MSDRDRIPVVVRGEMQVIVKDAEGNAVVAAGQFGKGCVVANGMCTGLGQGDAEVAPAGEEKDILSQAVKWLAG